MPQTVFGQTDSLALAIVGWLEGLESTFAVPFAAERRFRIHDDVADIPKWGAAASVDVFPDAESGDRQGLASIFSSEYAVHILIQQQLGSEGVTDSLIEERCALLAQFRSQIIENMKKRMFNLADAVHPVSGVFLSKYMAAKDEGLYSHSRLLQFNVFWSDTILIFKASV
jgi:hypothetical protein